MRITSAWLRLELRRRWGSLTVLAMLVLVSTATVLTATAGARRGDTALDRLWAQTRPATVSVLANQPGFDWARVRALPEVAALAEFPVTYGFSVGCCRATSTGWAYASKDWGRKIERPVLVAGRLFNPARADEVVVTPQFLASYHKRLGDTVTLLLATPQQADQGFDGSTGPARGPRIRARIVGVGNNTWDSVNGNGPGQRGAVIASPGLFAHYRANVLGTNGQAYVNALVRLKGGRAGDPGLPGRPRPGDRPVRHRCPGQLGALRRSGPAAHQLRGGVPARVRRGRADRRAVPGRPVGGQVHLGHGRRPAGTAGDRADRTPGHRRGRGRAGPGRRGGRRARGGRSSLGVALAADRRRVLPGAAPRHRRGLATPRPRLGGRRADGDGRRGGHGRADPGRRAAADFAAAIRGGRCGRDRRAPGANARRGPVRAGARARPHRGTGPADAGGRHRWRPRRARGVHVRRRGGGRRDQPGPVRPDLAAGYLSGRERARLHPGRRARAARGRGRSGRHRRRRRAGRRRAVRPDFG